MILEITENTTSFNCDIGDNFIRYDNNHNKIVDITITNIKQKINSRGEKSGKLIQFKCNICGFDCNDFYIKGEYRKDYWISLNKFKTRKCGCCSNKIVKKEINSIYKTNQEVVKYMVDKKDGDKYSKGANVKIKCHCICGKRVDYININQLILNNKVTCDNCSTRISYPNRFMFNLLKFSIIKFYQEKFFEWSKVTSENSHKKYYDFYLPESNTILELNGLQHYQDVKYFKSTLEESIKNDNCKKELAIKNGIKNYFVINCSFSNVSFIKESIINSGLLKTINIDENSIDWIKCSAMSIPISVKNVADKYNEGLHSRKGIAEFLKMKERLVKKYIKVAYENGLLINYTPEMAELESRFKSKIVCFNKENIYYEMTLKEISKSDIFTKHFTTSYISFCIRKQKPIEGIILKYKGEQL